jgi:hypothetical protein
MPNLGNKTKVISGKRIELEEFPTQLRIKDLKNNALYDLQESLGWFSKQIESIDKSSIPPNLLNLIQIFQNSVDEFLFKYHTFDTTITDVGVKGYETERCIAINIVKEYQLQKNTEKFPSGTYLSNRLIELADSRVRNKQPLLRNVDLRTCQLWLKKMKDGTFDNNDSIDDDF